MNQKQIIEYVQQTLKDAGEKITVDGKLGPETLSLLEKYDFKISLTKRLVIPATPISNLPISDKEFFGAKWVGSNVDLLGRYETDPILNARFTPGWKRCGLAGYKTLAGRSYAWCALTVNEDLYAVGITGRNSAGAAKWQTYGDRCDFMFGAILPIKHKGGGNHVAVFLYWIDEKNKIAATKDGNRGNQYCIAKTDLSGKGDTLPAGPRWPKGIPQGRLVSKSEVLAKYPFLKVGSSGTSTT